jgi:superfamily I DNA/RNA helicase
VLVLSGTGTGRSKLIAHRVAYLLTDRNLNPLNILTLLPHNKSTAEMRARIGKTLPWLGSYETICAKILRAHIHELGQGYTTHFKIASENDSIQIIKDLLGEQKKEEYPLEARAVFNEIRAAKHKGLGLCTKHYGRYVRHGATELNTTSRPTTCQEEIEPGVLCGKPVKAQGRCHAHLMQFYRARQRREQQGNWTTEHSQ